MNKEKNKLQKLNKIPRFKNCAKTCLQKYKTIWNILNIQTLFKNLIMEI